MENDTKQTYTLKEWADEVAFSHADSWWIVRLIVQNGWSKHFGHTATAAYWQTVADKSGLHPLAKYYKRNHNIGVSI